jgi:hypothetical protein
MTKFVPVDLIPYLNPKEPSTMPRATLFTPADRAHGEAATLRTQAKELLDKAVELETTAIRGWAEAEVDKQVRFVATIITPNRHVAYPEQRLGLYTFLKDIAAKYPTATGVVLSISTEPDPSGD